MNRNKNKKTPVTFARVKAMAEHYKRYLLVLVIVAALVTTLCTTLTASKYVAGSVGNDDGRIASFAVSSYLTDSLGEAQVLTFLVGVDAPGKTDSVYIMLDNDTVEVAVECKISLETYDRLPLDFTIEYGGTTYAPTISGGETYWTLSLSAQTSLLTTVNVAWSGSSNDIAYSGLTDLIMVTVQYTQVDTVA